VGYYTDASSWAGAEVLLGTLLAGLTTLIEAVVIGVDEPTVGKLATFRPGSATVLLPRAHGIRDLRGILIHRSAIADLGLDIFHANLSWLPACREALLAATSLRGLRVLAVENLPLDHHGARTRLVKHITSRRLDAHVAVGEAAARMVEGRALLRRGSVQVIHNGIVDLGPPSERVRGTDAVVVGCLARLDRIKGLDVLLNSIVSLPSVRVVVAGRGPERKPLEQLAARLGVAERVRFLDWVDSPRQLLQSFDVFVLPSRAEGFPLSIVEAMFAGLPVVATDVGSVREAVIEGETGILVPPDDSERLTGALRNLVDRPELRRQLGERGRAVAVERFTAERMVAAYEDLYEQLLSPRS
jgi:glycosyltransferase involved in cell wall biosynthesis